MKLSKKDIIEALAKNRTVEHLVENITRRRLDATTRDLCQEVYAYLLDFPDDKILDLYRCDQLIYFTVRIIWNQWYGSRSSFRVKLRSFSQRSVETEEIDGNQ